MHNEKGSHNIAVIKCIHMICCHYKVVKYLASNKLRLTFSYQCHLPI